MRSVLTTLTSITLRFRAMRPSGANINPLTIRQPKAGPAAVFNSVENIGIEIAVNVIQFTGSRNPFWGT